MLIIGLSWLHINFSKSELILTWCFCFLGLLRYSGFVCILTSGKILQIHANIITLYQDIYIMFMKLNCANVIMLGKCNYIMLLHYLI